jgi:hypothetical protein
MCAGLGEVSLGIYTYTEKLFSLQFLFCSQQLTVIPTSPLLLITTGFGHCHHSLLAPSRDRILNHHLSP